MGVHILSSAVVVALQGEVVSQLEGSGFKSPGRQGYFFLCICDESKLTLGVYTVWL